MPDDPSEVEGIEENLMDLVLNVKQLRFRVPEEFAAENDEFRVTLHTDGKTPGERMGADLELPEGVEVVDPDLYLLTASGKSKFEMELLVETGKGYSPADSREDVPPDMIPIDAMYTPVPKVNYIIEHTRVGQMTDYDRLLLEIWTDGSVQPDDALSQAARILTQYAASVAGYGRDSTDILLDDIAPPAEDDMDRPLEDLDLSMRTANALKRANINTVSQVLALNDSDLLGLRNFGQKSLDELREALEAHGYASPVEEHPAGDEDDEQALASEE